MLDPAFGGLDVSRETLVKLEAYQQLVQKWSPAINLVSKSDLNSLWKRHILDSAQLVALAPTPQRWVDLGAGGGFPGIVVAILLQKQGSARVTLVESDKRKCAFLMSAVRDLRLDVEVLARRVESLAPAGATTLSARALTTLDQLVGYAHVLLAPEGMALFPKGFGWRNELQAVKEKWSFECDVVQSRTDSEAAILRLQNIKRI